MLHDQTQTSLIELSRAAANAVLDLLEKKGLKDHALRIYVTGGGCSGLQYGMALENNVIDGDLIFNQHGVRVVVDEKSIEYLRGVSIDYVDELMGTGFKIHNPNAFASCGCGSSFRTEGDSGNPASCGMC